MAMEICKISKNSIGDYLFKGSSLTWQSCHRRVSLTTGFQIIHPYIKLPFLFSFSFFFLFNYWYNLKALSSFSIAVLVWADIPTAYALFVMMTYLRKVWSLNITHAAAIVNVFTGVAAIMPIGMTFLVDAFMGDYWMLLLSSLAYSFVGFQNFPNFLYVSTMLWLLPSCCLNLL